MHMTMKTLLLIRIASISDRGSDMIVLDNLLKIYKDLITLPNDNVMEKFYELWWFLKVEISVEVFFWKFEKIRKFKRKALLLYELSERESGWRYTARCHNS